MNLPDFVRGCTFDDFLLMPQLGVVPSRDPAAIDLSTNLSEHVTLHRPIVSANMDTITRSAMAIVLAEEGGIGIIDRGYRAGDIAPQVAEVTAVKRTQHGIISDPHTIGEDASIAEAERVMARTGVGTLVVVDGNRRLRGLLTQRDVRFVLPDARVADRMTSGENLIVHTGEISLTEAARIMAARKIKKLPLVNRDGTVLGLMTAKDLLKHQQHPFATRDERGRLRVGAAVGATGDYLERATDVLRAGADVLVIDIAHGHSQVMEKAIERLRARLGAIELIAGNVATADGARFLAERGVQVEALVQCRLAVDHRVPLIADGGVKRDGSIAQALLFGGRSVMLGSVFAGTEETPGDVVLKSVLMSESQKVVQVPFKVFRGMASIGAVRDRLDLEDADPGEVEALGAEGLEVSVPARGSVRSVIHDMLKHLCSAISYGGAQTLREFQERFWSNPERYLVKLSAAAQRESFQR